jgi:NitT/TauT family transport system substrate-binding protein
MSIVVFSLWFVFLSAGCLFAAELEKVRVGLSSISATHGALWVAEEKGIFRKYGIDPEVIVIGGGGARGVSALIAGDIQFVTAAGDSVISAGLRGADAVMIAGILNKGVQRVVTRPEIKTPADLIGRRVGVTRYGAASHLVLLMMLRKWGISPDKVQVLQVESSSAMVVNLEKGGIDAAVLTIPSNFVAEDKGYRVLADLADMDIYYLNMMLDTTRAFLRSYRDRAVRFTKAFVEGIAYFKKNKQQSVEVLKKKLRSDRAGEDFLARSYDVYASKQYERAPYPSVEGVKTVLEFLAQENPKARTADPNSFIDNSIIKELEASGFIRDLYAK